MSSVRLHVPISKRVEKEGPLRIILTFHVTVKVVISDSDSDTDSVDL